MAQNEIWYETLHAGFGQYFTVDKVLYREKPSTVIWLFLKTPLSGALWPSTAWYRPPSATNSSITKC